MMPTVDLRLGDCLTILGDIPADAAIVSDPPYGMGLASKSGTGRSKAAIALDDYRIHDDDRPFDPSPWIMFRSAVLWGANHYADRLPPARCWLVWDKREGGTSDDQGDCELAWTTARGPERLFHHRWRGMIKASERNQKRVHPTQKPIALMRWCIERLKLKPGTLIVDPYMGSGTTGVAAVQLGHPFLGIEIDPAHFATAQRRIAAEQSRHPLLEPA